MGCNLATPLDILLKFLHFVNHFASEMALASLYVRLVGGQSGIMSLFRL